MIEPQDMNQGIPQMGGNVGLNNMGGNGVGGPNNMVGPNMVGGNNMLPNMGGIVDEMDVNNMIGGGGGNIVDDQPMMGGNPNQNRNKNFNNNRNFGGGGGGFNNQMGNQVCFSNAKWNGEYDGTALVHTGF